MLRQEDLFVGGTNGYHTYRIPALVVSQRGTLLAFCEGRRFDKSDSGAIDIMLRRSDDHGETSTDLQVVVDGQGDTAGNPAPVLDTATGTLWLLFCRNLADGDENEICAGRAPRTVWLTCSHDDGKTWEDPQEITPSVKKPCWTWYATGPCHGIQLTCGRLVIPCDHIVGVHKNRQTDPYHAHIIYSDDHGASWQIGGIVGEGTNESVATETAAGLYLNCRQTVKEKRAYAYSVDGGNTFGSRQWDDALVEPKCQGSAIGYPSNDGSCPTHVVFSNPASTHRERLTVRWSEDSGKSWNAGRLLHPGPAAYSDLAVLPNGWLACLYERGLADPYERITLARFPAEWVSACLYEEE